MITLTSTSRNLPSSSVTYTGSITHPVQVRANGAKLKTYGLLQRDPEWIRRQRGHISDRSRSDSFIQLQRRSCDEGEDQHKSNSRSAFSPIGVGAGLGVDEAMFLTIYNRSSSSSCLQSNHCNVTNGRGSDWSELYPRACDILKDALLNKSKYKKLLKVEGNTAQLVLDVMQMILDYPATNQLDPEFENILLKAMLRLSKYSTLYPRAYILTDVKRNEYPFASGHFGEVFQGDYNGRKVSLKVFKLYSNEMSKINDLLKAFFKEAILWRHIAHHNLLPFYGIYQLGDSGGRICLVSPWMDNGNITQYLQRNPQVDRQDLILDIIQGISYLHKKSIVHGDLKGANVLISENGVACLADFGLSSVVNTHSLVWTSIESTVSNAGTVRWQAPELLDEESVGTTKESDIYAFACVCYEVFVGKVPFYQYSFDPTVMRQLMLGYRPLKPELNSAPYIHWGLTDWMWSLIVECWHQDSTARPEAPEVVERLSARKELLRDDIRHQDNWGDLRPEVFRSLLDQRCSISEADVQRSISLLSSL
ncbi:kinase-like domain-containing protein [Cyathus striatus]|nr:kinase-like domain-containing protein [Cyathus striatus]